MSEAKRYFQDETATVTCGTTKGEFQMNFIREWSPNGYDRAIELFERGFYDHSHFFRCIHGFLVQFGISYTNDEELKQFAYSPIKDDPQLIKPIKFTEGMISFAGNGKNSRTSHLFIAYDAVPSLGRELWETPVGYVAKQSMDSVIWKLYDGYGDTNGPQQHLLMHPNGKSYANSNYPKLDSFGICTVKRHTLDHRELVDELSEWNYMHFENGEQVVYEEHTLKKESSSMGVILVMFFGFVIFCVLVIKNRNKIFKKE